jgi:hypothetical protein
VPADAPGPAVVLETMRTRVQRWRTESGYHRRRAARIPRAPWQSRPDCARRTARQTRSTGRRRSSRPALRRVRTRVVRVVRSTPSEATSRLAAGTETLSVRSKKSGARATARDPLDAEHDLIPMRDAKGLSDCLRRGDLARRARSTLGGDGQHEGVDVDHRRDDAPGGDADRGDQGGVDESPGARVNDVWHHRGEGRVLCVGEAPQGDLAPEDITRPLASVTRVGLSVGATQYASRHARRPFRRRRSALRTTRTGSTSR